MRLSFLHPQKTQLSVLLLKAVIVIIPLIVIFSLLNHHLLITSSLRYTYQPGDHVRVIGPSSPSTIVKTADPALPWKITTDVFPFKILIPRLIQAVRVRIRLELGTQPYTVLNVPGKKGTNFSTLINAEGLNTLSWKHVSDGVQTLWMQEKHTSQETIATGQGKNTKSTTTTIEQPLRQYASIEDFRAAPPNMQTVGLVGIDRMTFAKVTNYSPSSTPVRVGHTLRGSHQLYVYAANETLKLTFDKVDLNRASGADVVTVRVARVSDMTASHQRWLKTITVGDDGIIGNKGPRGKSQPVTVTLPDVPSGMYFIDISTSDDVLLANMTSMQHWFSFNGRVVIAEGPAYAEPTFTPVTLWTSGTAMTVAANHDQGKQEFLVAGKKYLVEDVKIQHVVSKLSGTTKISIPKGDAVVTSDGLLTFDGSSLLPDGAREVDLTGGTPDTSSYDYILANYIPQTKDEVTVDQTYQLNDIAMVGKTITMNIESPGLQANGANLGIKDIQVTMIRGPFPWTMIWKKLGLKK